MIKKMLLVVFFLHISFICYSSEIYDDESKAFIKWAYESNYVALVEITSSKVKVIDDPDFNNVKYFAKVIEKYKGTLKSNIVFNGLTEKGGYPISNNSKLVVILCEDDNGKMYLPDFFFAFPAKEKIVNLGRYIKNNYIDLKEINKCIDFEQEDSECEN